MIRRFKNEVTDTVKDVYLNTGKVKEKYLIVIAKKLMKSEVLTKNEEVIFFGETLRRIKSSDLKSPKVFIQKLECLKHLMVE